MWNNYHFNVFERWLILLKHCIYLIHITDNWSFEKNILIELILNKHFKDDF